MSKCGVGCKYDFLTDLLLSPMVKKVFKNRSAFGEVTGKGTVTSGMGFSAALYFQFLF